MANRAPAPGPASDSPALSPLPGRVVLVGAGRAVRQAAAALGQLEAAPVILGSLTPHPASEPGVTPAPRSGAAGAPGVEPPADLGDLDHLESVLTRLEPDLVVLTAPQAMSGLIDALASRLTAAGAVWRFMATVDDQLAGKGWGPSRRSTVADARPFDGRLGVDTPSLIGRPPRQLDEDAIRRAIAGRSVLITGAGGSIGSQLACDIARFQPRELVLVERSENALFDIDRRIARLAPALPRTARLHDVTRVRATRTLLDELRPDVVFHAAAHKHVPVMEDHPADAVENNFYGTRSIADAADAAGVERFVMISTDKAVNPTSVMGASKRLAELYVQWLGTRSPCRFAMVRFGNVLGSACSVLPIWTEQLAEGGPITVTDRAMKRYFMTIPEAAGLVVQASAYLDPARVGGEIFLLDMGEPVSILELAERFIRSHGLTPGVDVAIRITGARPGEKLFEELASTGEDMAPTPHPSILRWRAAPPSDSRMRRIIDHIDRLRGASRPDLPAWSDVSPASVVAALRAAVPEMIQAAAG